jgi:transposase InsO family protein
VGPGFCEKKRRCNPNRAAEQAGQTLNIDLCFIPLQHQPQVKLPAVSGSSGHLVVERTKSETKDQWPGCTFENYDLSYTEAMQVYIGLTRERLKHSKTEKVPKTGRKAEKQALRRTEEALREERYQIRERRKQEDTDWRAFRKQVKLQQSTYRALGKLERRAQQPLHTVLHQQWRQALKQHQTCLQERLQEDARWRTQRQSTLKAEPQSGWLAILVVTDNCTRQCLGLPLFVAGSKVTSEMVTQALKELLPPELEYLISDQGSHFRTIVFAQLAQEMQFIWVPVARHRPESNGIAERFVRTLKEWFADKFWESPDDVSNFLAQFIFEYNNRPHQGLAISGLSPNEFAKRIWLM